MNQVATAGVRGNAFTPASGSVLVATPARAGTPGRILAQADEVYANLSYGQRERALYLNTQPDYAEKFMPNAAARNQLIDRWLQPWQEWVLWLDVDIIETPPDLIERLIEVSERHGNGIAAPMVWMETVGDGPVGFDNGGWFYDTGGFMTDDGLYADYYEGPQGAGDELLMQSVGCVYLAPAWLYRQGVRYNPTGGAVEHVSFCREARRRGLDIVATKAVKVIHAFLPEWGETWAHKAVAGYEDTRILSD